MNKENDKMIRRQQTKTGTTKWKYERQEQPNEQLNYINNIKTRMTELTTINQSTPINYINNGETERNNNEDNIASVTILRGTTEAVGKNLSNQIQEYKHEQLCCKKHSFSILNYCRDRRTKNTTTTNSRHLEIIY